MSALLLDTNVVSILFNRNHGLRDAAIRAVEGRQLAISFMSRAELLLWPAVNNWGELRRAALLQHLGLYTALYPDELTCAVWVDIIASCRRAGKAIHIADAWIAATARQWGLPLVTADLRDFERVEDLSIVLIR